MRKVLPLFLFIGVKSSLFKESASLIEGKFLLDHLRVGLTYDVRQERMEQMNMNYLKSFKEVYDFYKNKGMTKEAQSIRFLAYKIIDSNKEKETQTKVKDWFEG